MSEMFFTPENQEDPEFEQENSQQKDPLPFNIQKATKNDHQFNKTAENLKNKSSLQKSNHKETHIEDSQSDLQASLPSEPLANNSSLPCKLEPEIQALQLEFSKLAIDSVDQIFVGSKKNPLILQQIPITLFNRPQIINSPLPQLSTTKEPLTTDMPVPPTIPESPKQPTTHQAPPPFVAPEPPMSPFPSNLMLDHMIILVKLKDEPINVDYEERVGYLVTYLNRVDRVFQDVCGSSDSPGPSMFMRMIQEFFIYLAESKCGEAGLFKLIESFIDNDMIQQYLSINSDKESEIDFFIKFLTYLHDFTIKMIIKNSDDEIEYNLIEENPTSHFYNLFGREKNILDNDFEGRGICMEDILIDFSLVQILKVLGSRFLYKKWRKLRLFDTMSCLTNNQVNEYCTFQGWKVKQCKITLFSRTYKIPANLPIFLYHWCYCSTFGHNSYESELTIVSFFITVLLDFEINNFRRKKIKFTQKMIDEIASNFQGNSLLVALTKKLLSKNMAWIRNCIMNMFEKVDSDSQPKRWDAGQFDNTFLLQKIEKVIRI